MRSYLIDTSSLANVGDGTSASSDRWHVIDRLIAEGRLKTVHQVFNELKAVDPEAHRRLKPRKKAMVVRSNRVGLMKMTGVIAHRHPSMAHPRSRKDRADPYVVAAAKLNGFCVVTDESTRRKGHMPSVCDAEEVAHCCLEDLLAKEWRAKRG